jgi:uncharacterized protein YprB with RNaseH-like and TPR domain/RNA polymerase subunit RPABC4/transcription elongation factor Spt4
MPNLNVEKKISETKIPKILFFDIETTDLNAEFGEVICFGYKWKHEKEPHVLYIYDYKGWDKLSIENRDKYIMKEIIKILEEADIIVGHYSKRFDHPFLQTRALIHKMGPIPKPLHIDTWDIARRNLKCPNNRLATIARTLRNLNQKDSVSTIHWRRSKAHVVKSIKLIGEYCIQDVLTLIGIAEKIFAFSNNIPGWNVITEEEKPRCPVCGGYKFQSRGFIYTKLYSYKRLSCKKCGKFVRERNSCTLKNNKRYY